MTAVATPAPTVARPGWLRSFFAVFVAGFIVGSAANLMGDELGWRAAVTAESMAWGWPYGVDGLWSFTACSSPGSPASSPGSARSEHRSS